MNRFAIDCWKKQATEIFHATNIITQPLGVILTFQVSWTDQMCGILRISITITKCTVYLLSFYLKGNE